MATYTVAAGKWDGNERNVKFVSEVHDCLHDVLYDVQYCQGYPWIEVEMIDGNYRVVFDASNIQEIPT